MKKEALESCLLGGALGDSIGLPMEGLSAKRIAALYPSPLRQRLFFGHGMVSDDTEHAVMTLLSLKAANADPKKFAKQLAGHLRWWFAMIPAGIGLATARSILKLWIGISPSRSGVVSAGNGPLMRAPIIGAYFPTDKEIRERFVETSTIITHRDPRATEAAQIIAHAAALASQKQFDSEKILNELATHIQSEEMATRLPILKQSLNDNESVQKFASRICKRPGYVTGFACDSAAVAIFSWLRHRNDFPATIEAVIQAGGDTDTIAFIAGSIAGIDCGTDQLPKKWVGNLCDWPLNASFLKKIAEGQPAKYPQIPIGILRNAVFLGIVLYHGFRRLFPPY